MKPIVECAFVIETNWTIPREDLLLIFKYFQQKYWARIYQV